MEKREVFVIEINMDDDFASSCAYHVDDFESTSQRNLRNVCEKIETDRWVIVGLAWSLSSALDKCELLRQKLCAMHGRIPYTLEDMLENSNIKELLKE